MDTEDNALVARPTTSAVASLPGFAPGLIGYLDSPNLLGSSYLAVFLSHPCRLWHHRHLKNFQKSIRFRILRFAPLNAIPEGNRYRAGPTTERLSFQPALPLKAIRYVKEQNTDYLYNTTRGNICQENDQKILIQNGVFFPTFLWGILPQIVAGLCK